MEASSFLCYLFFKQGGAGGAWVQVADLLVALEVEYRGVYETSDADPFWTPSLTPLNPLWTPSEPLAYGCRWLTDLWHWRLSIRVRTKLVLPTPSGPSSDPLWTPSGPPLNPWHMGAGG
jgi:hypothetical protein